MKFAFNTHPRFFMITKPRKSGQTDLRLNQFGLIRRLNPVRLKYTYYFVKNMTSRGSHRNTRKASFSSPREKEIDEFLLKLVPPCFLTLMLGHEHT